jgi:hypothetical protein
MPLALSPVQNSASKYHNAYRQTMRPPFAFYGNINPQHRTQLPQPILENPVSFQTSIAMHKPQFDINFDGMSLRQMKQVDSKLDTMLAKMQRKLFDVMEKSIQDNDNTTDKAADESHGDMLGGFVKNMLAKQNSLLDNAGRGGKDIFGSISTMGI